MAVSGVSDSSYNGSFQVTSIAGNTLTYVSNGPDSTSTGGTVSLLTGGYVLYPMAEVLSVYNPTTKSVDGQLTLAANTVAWAAGDAVEIPHYLLNLTSGSSTAVSATAVNVGWSLSSGTPPQGCSLMPRNAAAAAVSGTIFTGAPSSSGWTVNVGTTALAASTNYAWSYQCF